MRASRSGVQILENGGVLLLYLRSEEARSRDIVDDESAGCRCLSSMGIHGERFK